MSVGNPEFFPWGSNVPNRRQRLFVAFAIALVGVLAVGWRYTAFPGHHSDFGQIWFAARAMLHGIDPYPLVGPGRAFDWSWPLFYPATSFVLASPLAVFPEALASVLFVAVSVFPLAYGATRESWHRLPAFASAPFALAAGAAQWSPLYAAVWFFPWLAFVVAAKPQLAFPVLVRSHRAWAPSVTGTIVLVAASLLLLPHWPAYWLEALRMSDHMRPPVLQFGGFLSIIALYRWRDPRAWAVFLLACTPQSPSFYDVLLLLVIVPETYREATVLSLVSSIGFFIAVNMPQTTEAEYHALGGAVRALTCYFPAALAVALRPGSVQLSARAIR